MVRAIRRNRSMTLPRAREMPKDQREAREPSGSGACTSRKEGALFLDECLSVSGRISRRCVRSQDMGGDQRVLMGNPPNKMTFATREKLPKVIWGPGVGGQNPPPKSSVVLFGFQSRQPRKVYPPKK